MKTSVPGVIKAGVVEGSMVKDILLDTGCSRTLVRKDLVPQDKLLQGEATAIGCAHGDTVVYPLAQVEVQVDSQTIDVEAAVSETLPMAVLLGTDVPQLPGLLKGKLMTEEHNGPESALVVTARAAARK